MTEYVCPMIEYSRLMKDGRKTLDLFCKKFRHEDIPDLGCYLEVKGDLLYCSKRAQDSFIGRLSELDPDIIKDVMRLLEDEFINNEP